MAGLYIHIPFCHCKCAYCDFYSLPSKGREHQAVCQALADEWMLRRWQLGHELLETVYIGGGTPSILDPDMLLASVMPHVPLRDVKEFTIEVNPEDVSESRTRSWLNGGVNRISMGIQSFNDKELIAVGRRHSAQQALKAVDVLRNQGVENLSLDLIYGLPGQSYESWVNNLDVLMSLRPEHFSAYCLSLEPGTRLWAKAQTGRFREAPETLVEKMYLTLIETAERNGYEHYEISNFSLPGRHSRHNSAYWAGIPYLGLGPSAHSLTANGQRRYNPSAIKPWLEKINAGHDPSMVDEETPTDVINDKILTALRTRAGLKLTDLSPEIANHVRSKALNTKGFEVEDMRVWIPHQHWLISNLLIEKVML